MKKRHTTDQHTTNDWWGVLACWIASHTFTYGMVDKNNRELQLIVA